MLMLVVLRQPFVIVSIKQTDLLILTPRSGIIVWISLTGCWSAHASRGGRMEGFLENVAQMAGHQASTEVRSEK